MIQGSPDEQLCSIGVALGADVPFCITGGTRLCQGVGEIMSNLPSPDCAFVIIKPDVGILHPRKLSKSMTAFQTPNAVIWTSC